MQTTTRATFAERVRSAFAMVRSASEMDPSLFEEAFGFPYPTNIISGGGRRGRPLGSTNRGTAGNPVALSSIADSVILTTVQQQPNSSLDGIAETLNIAGGDKGRLRVKFNTWVGKGVLSESGAKDDVNRTYTATGVPLPVATTAARAPRRRAA